MLGALLTVIGPTGSILVFWNEIDELMYPDIGAASRKGGGFPTARRDRSGDRASSAGLACAVLYVTGAIRWLQKRKARATAKRRNRP